MLEQPYRRIAILLAALAAACSYEGDGQMSQSQNFAVFDESPRQVIETLTDVLVQRDALSSDALPGLRGTVLDALRARQEAHLSSESVPLGPGELADLVPEEYRQFIGDQGGRYVLEFTLEPAADGGLRLTVTPTIIATVGGGEGPLGGRPLPSNGSLESSVLDALARRLGG